MARKTKQQAQATRNSILLAAADVFWEKGVSNASLENIAERAGVTRGAVYWHFKNKADIFDALHEELHRTFYDVILADMKNDHPQPLKQLEELCVALMLDLEHNHFSRKILSIFIIRCDYTGDMEVFLTRQCSEKEDSARLFTNYFRRAIDKGHLPVDADPDILTMSLFCYISGMMHEYLRHPEFIDIRTQVPLLFRQFFSGLRC